MLKVQNIENIICEFSYDEKMMNFFLTAAHQYPDSYVLGNYILSLFLQKINKKDNIHKCKAFKIHMDRQNLTTKERQTWTLRISFQSKHLIYCVI